MSGISSACLTFIKCSHCFVVVVDVGVNILSALIII